MARHATEEGQILSLEQANLFDRALRLSMSDLIREATKLGYDEGYQEGLADERGRVSGYVFGRKEALGDG